MADIVYVVLDGQYDSSIEAVYDSAHEDAARRFSEALRDGRYYPVALNSPDMIDFPYTVEYDTNGDSALVWMALDKEWSDEITLLYEGCYRVFVCATNYRDAERFAKIKVLRYLGRDDEALEVEYYS